MPMDPAAGKEAGPAKKKARRSSRHGEAASPSHYGPVTCASAAAALVQAYLAIDNVAAAAAAAAAATAAAAAPAAAASVPATDDSGAKDGSRTTRAASDSNSSCFLYMSESRFDPVKRRFGGKSKPVSMASPGDSTGRGARLSFGPAAKVVATKEAMHTALHCRCVFVLLREVSSEGAAKSPTASASASAPSSQGEGRPASERGSASRSRRTDTAHLIALSPDDLFLALSVDSFPLVTAVEGEGNSRGGARTGSGGGGGGSSNGGGSSGGSSNNSNSNRRSHAPAAASALSRAFEIMDGPVVVHRPPSRLGEPWRGLEVYRPEAAAPRGDGATGPWRGQRLPLPAGLWLGQGEHRGAGDGRRGQGDGNGLAPGSAFGGGGGGGGVGGGGSFGGSDRLGGGVRHDSPFRLDLSAATNFDLNPPASNGDIARCKKRGAPGAGAGAGAGVGCALLVSPPSPSLSAGANTDISGCGSLGRRTNSGGRGECFPAVVALPAAAAAAAGSSSSAAAAAAAAADATVSTHPAPNWMSLLDDREGRTASLSPWGGAPRGLLESFTCLCRAPEVDAGVVALAGASPGGAAERGLVLRPHPPTVYVGATAAAAAAAITVAAAAGSRGGGDSSSIGSGGGGGGVRGSVDAGGGGALLELQGGGTLSCSRSLPAPPWAVMTAAVDDAQGVLVVLLADAAGTALLLARDGSDFPVVEEYRAVASAFAGDFLDNGREQVALLPTVASAVQVGAGSGGGGTPGGRRGAAAPASAAAASAAARAGAGCGGGGGWEQLPLKTLVKRALVTDCSSVLGNVRRDDLTARPGAGPIQIVGARPSGGEGGVSASGASRGTATGAASTAASIPEATKGNKRHRPRGEDDDDGDGGGGGGGDGKVGSANGLAKVGPVVGGSSVLSRSSSGGTEDGHRLDNLSTVVDVLRRRVQAEEARLLRLRQARRGKAAALEAAKLALSVQVGSDVGSAQGDRLPEPPPPWIARSTARAFYDGQTFPGDASVSAPPWIDEAPAETAAPPLRCAIARVRFHAPSRTLCLDALITNPSPRPAVTNNGDKPVDASPPAAAGVVAAASAAVTNVCLTASSVCGRLTARSAVCPSLGPGESATVRACVDVPLDLLVGGGGSGSDGGCGGGGNGGGSGGGGGERVKAGEAAPLYVSCMWGFSDADCGAEEEGTRGSAAAGGATAAAVAAAGMRSVDGNLPCSIIFARVLVSPRDMLGVGPLSSAAEAPPLSAPEGKMDGVASFISTNSSVGGRNGGVLASRTNSRKPNNARKSSADGDHNGGGGGENGLGNDRQHLGLFDVGTRLDLLVRSDTSASLASLPQAVRSLSAVASLPEPWAGGAAVTVAGCSERAAECTLRAGGDSPGASAVLLAVAAGALPDGARASADHASRQGRELVVAAASALGDETAALEAVARARRRVGAKSAPPAEVGVGEGGGGGGDEGVGAARELAEALRRYAAAQMKSDVLVAQVVGRVAAAATGAADGGTGQAALE